MVAVRCSQSSVIAVVARRVGSGSRVMVRVCAGGLGWISPVAVRAWNGQSVGLVGGAGVAGADPDLPREGGEGVVGGHPDGVGDQLGLDVEDLLAGMHVPEWESGGERGVRGGQPVGCLVPPGGVVCPAFSGPLILLCLCGVLVV